MKKLIGAALISAAACLGGCVTTSEVQSEITTVQQAAVAACGFLPDVASVTNLIASFVPGAAAGTAIGTQIAGAICSGVTAVGASGLAGASRRGAGAPGAAVVQGVAVSGKFVR